MPLFSTYSLNSFSTLLLLFLLVKFLLTIYLISRQYRYVMKKMSVVPHEFKNQISLEKHAKASNYTISRLKFSLISLPFKTFILLAWLIGGGIGYLDLFIRQNILLLTQSSTNEFVILSLFVLSFSLLNILIDIPFSLYETFVLEEKFGHNKTTPSLYLKDLLKEFLLETIIMVLLLWILGMVMKSFYYWWPLAALALLLFQLVALFIYPIFIAPLFNKFTPFEEGELKSEIENFLKNLNFPFHGLFKMDASSRSTLGNAYFTGFGKSRRIVFYDTLLKSLEPKEILAVLAHEVGHYKRKHVFKMFLFFMGGSSLCLWVLWQLSQHDFFFTAFRLPLENYQHNPPSYLTLLYFSMILPIFTFPFTPLFSYLSRRHEFEADEFASKAIQSNFLISALTKMYQDNDHATSPDPYYALFYYSHPDPITRVEHLKKLSFT